MKCKMAFTIVEMLVVLTLMVFILIIAYKVFFSQARMVAQSMEFMKVNDHFRRIVAFLGNDIREATTIVSPRPVKGEEALNQQTPAAGGEVLRIVKQEIDPSVKFSTGGPSSNWTATGTFEQVVRVRDIVYTLEKNPNPLAKMVPRFKLIRTEYVEDKSEPGVKMKQSVEITDALREFTVFRTLRKPMKALNISSLKDRMLLPVASPEAGTGNDLVHFRITLERQRINEQGEAYEISLNTSFYKRGKEVFLHQ